VSGEVISMQSFRKSQMMSEGGEDTYEEDMIKAHDLIQKTMKGLVESAAKRSINFHLLSYQIFLEGLIAVESHGWTTDEMIERIRSLEKKGFFDEEEEEEPL
jgi:hypothetical protein